jgi:hypothetical protein
MDRSLALKRRKRFYANPDGSLVLLAEMTLEQLREAHRREGWKWSEASRMCQWITEEVFTRTREKP